MEMELARFASLLPVNKAVSKIDLIYKVKTTITDDNKGILALLYLLPFHRIIKKIDGNLLVF